MLILFWLLCVTTVASSILLGDNCTKPFELNFRPVSECISEICKTTLSFRPTVILKHGGYESGEYEFFFEYMINTLSGNNIQQVVFEDLNDVKNVVPQEADWMTVLYLGTCKSVFDINITTIQDKIKYLIVVSHNIINDCNDKFQQIGKDVANYDVTFIVRNLEIKDVYNLITFIPQINEDTCKQVVRESEKINICRNGTLESSKIFPNKNPTNLKKCLLNAGIGPLYPFAIIKDRSRFKTFDDIEETEIRGSDLELLKIVAKQYNATLKYHFIQKHEENPLGQYEFVPFIMNGSLDVCAGGFYRIYGDSVSYSGIYARQSVLWMYTVDRTSKSWQNLVGKVNGLYVFIIYYVSYCLIWYLIRKFDDEVVSFISTLIYAWGALVGADSLPNARSLKQKIVNLMYLIMCIHLSAYVGVQFYSFFTISEPPEILETNDDVMKSGRTSYLINSLKYFVFEEKFIKFINESKECYSFRDCCEKSLIYKGMTILLQGVLLKFQAQTAVDDEAKVLGSTENVLTVYYEMLIRKNSPYVTKFRALIKRLFEAGIPERLYTEAIGLTVVGKAKSASENIVGNSYSCQAGCKITLEQLDGAFYVWLIGCGISSCIFIVELIYKRENRAVVI